MPTSEVFAVNFSRDIKHIIDSREPDKVDALIQLLKKVQRRHIAKQASGEAENTTEPNKPQKPTGDSVGQLINYINAVLDDIQQLRACRSSNPHVSKKIRIELTVAYHETKKCVEKIRAEHPEIKDAPAESDDQEKYLRSAHTWCVGQLFWENGERIGAEKTADKSAEKPAEIQQSQRTEIPSEIKLLEQVADKLEEWANRVEPKLPAHIGHISFYGSLKKALDNLSDLAFTWLRSRMPRHLDSIQKDFNDLYEKAKAVDHERSESGGEANILKCQAQAAAKKLAQKLRLIVKMTKENLVAEKPAETEQSQQTEIPSEIKLMKQIAEHLRIWFRERSDDKCYPSGTVPLRFRNGISLKLEFEVYLDQVLTWLRVNDQKKIARSLEQERDSFLSDLQTVEQAIERGDNPPLELIELRSKITGLIGTLEHTAKVFTDKLVAVKPAEAEHIPSKMLGDTFTIWGLTINWRVIYNKLKKRLLRLGAFLHKEK